MFPIIKWASMALTATLLAACGGGDGASELVLPDANTLCSSVGVKPKIINGADCVQPESSPVVLVLSLGSEGQTQSCTGTMLTPTRVLTAAHCMLSGTQRMAVVQWQTNGNSALVYATAWVAHPGYTTNGDGLQNDAGVITLKSAMSNPTMPLLVSSTSTKGDEVFIAGWGDPGQSLAVGYARITKVTESHLGYVYKGQASNTCAGDSGGPAYRSAGGPVGIVGVTSSGSVDGCGDGDNSLFTNIQTPRVLDFIRAQAPGLAEI
ncbi:trypsin-like serine protease [Hydrogenophaga sp. PAMC20947]|uniref:S1 family peptidase n=1 Tax=Hydrogenophaga sp. PAMC20947 TaxID=2565558 RepID=UPI00109DB6F9|nr:trypsin-like serine protease [Hydrogenophaga sp. PAMC20947]QCB47362.1 trypsin-like serine protease [Hydrogenophaga sp. PAMC20947]